MLNRIKSKIKQTRPYQFFFRSKVQNLNLDASRDENQVLDDIASWVVSAESSELDYSTMVAAKRAVLDALVALILGTQSTEGHSILRFAEILSGARRKCYIYSSKGKLSCSLAAYAGSALCQVHDVNDGHPAQGEKGASFHPGRVIVPTALALAQEANLTGKQFLKSVAIGYDVALNVMNGPIGSPSDAYGASAVACYAYGLSKEEVSFALRLAGFSASKSGAEDFEVNNLTCAQQARGGVESAEMVRLGYPISKSLPSRCQLFRFDTPENLGVTLKDLYFKPYPSCRYTHPFIEAAFELRPKVIEKLDSIKVITICLQKAWFGIAYKIGPREYFKSYQFSASYCTVLALIDGQVGLQQFTPECTDDELAQSIQNKVIFKEYHTESATSHSQNSFLGGSLKIELNDGSIFTHDITVARGSAENPLTNEELVMKLVDWNVISLEKAEGLINIVMSLDTMNTMDELIHYLQELGGSCK